MKNKPETETQAKGFRAPYASLAFLTFVLLLFIGFWGHMAVQGELRQSLASQLETHLKSNRESVRLWMENQKRFVQSWAGEHWLQRALARLIFKAQQSNYRPEKIKKFPELKVLREGLEPVVKRYEMIGFVVFDKTGTQVGALLDDPLGRRDLYELSDFVNRSLHGEVVVSVPFQGEVPLPDKEGVFHEDWPTMFVSAPVHGEDENIIGVLAFRIRPEQSFTRVLEISRIGETGETFAFNTEGYFLSAPRNREELIQEGLLKRDPDETGILKVRLVRPQKSKNPREILKPVPKDLHFTEMARSALQRESGSNTEGYINHRGKLVAGAWTWLEDSNIGLGVEQEVREAFAPLIAVRTVLFGIFILLGLMTAVSLVLRIRQVKVTEKEREAQKQLDRLNRQNKLILEAAGEGIFGVDLDGVVTFINPAGADLLGSSTQEIIGRFQYKFMKPLGLNGEPYSSKDNPVNQVCDDGEVRSVTGHFYCRKRGAIFPVEYTVKPIMEDEDRVGAVVTFRDISERMKAEQELVHYAGDLEKINTELSNFTSVATHDLQEPLRKVVTLADRLILTNESRLNQHGKYYLERIVSSVTRMQQLIVDLLEYSRATSQQQSFAPVNLADQIQEALQVLEIQIEKTQGMVKVDPLPIIEGSAFQIRQLFQNLIGNALKFHKEDVPPQIHIYSEKKENDSWTITVEDNGIGFDLRYKDRIFQPFRRLHRREEIEGSGIGLAVCQKIVTLHHGAITAESEIGKGARFQITLPEKQ